MTMSKVLGRKTAILLFAFVFLFCMVGLALSAARANAETGETTENVLVDLDFEEDTDGNGFMTIWSGWEISEGIFKPVEGWASTYLMQKFSFADNELKISMDFYYESAFNVGLTTDPTVATSDASTGDGIGVRFGTQDVSVKTSIGGSADTWLSAADVTFNDSKTHTLEIAFKPDKTVTVKVDGNELTHSQNMSLSLTNVAFGEAYDFTEGQLVFKTSDPNAYIDNLKISQIVPAGTEEPTPEPVPDADYSYDFEEDADGNSFLGAYYSGWQVKDGHFSPAAGGASTYLAQKLSFAESDLKITLDFNYVTGFYIGLSEEPSQFASDATDKNEAVDGIAVQFGNGSIGLSGSLERGKWLNGSDEKLNDGETHQLEILFKTNQTITVKVDGEELCHSAGSLPSFTDFSFASEFQEGFTQGYLVMKGYETETYIDNLKIENVEESTEPAPDPGLTGDIALDFTANDAANGYFTTALYAGWEVKDGIFKPTVAWADTYLMQAFSFENEELKIEMDIYFQTNLSIGFSNNYKNSPNGDLSASDGIALRFTASGVGMYTSVDGAAAQIGSTAQVTLGGSIHRLGLVFKPDKTVSVTIDGSPLADNMTDVEFGSAYDFTAGYLVMKAPDAAAYIDNLTVTGEETEIPDEGGGTEEPDPGEDDEPVYDEPIDYRLTVGDLVSQKHPNDPGNDYWMGAPGNDNNAYFTAWNTANPGNGYAVALAFTAPADGTVAPEDGMIGWAYRAAGASQGDGKVRAAVFLNNEKIFPVINKSWERLSTSSDAPTEFAVESFAMKAGDVLYVVFENGGDGNSDYDTLEYSFRFRWTDATYTDLLFDAARNEKEGGILGGCGWMTAEEGDAFYSDGTTSTAYKKRDLLSYHYATVLECPPVDEAEEITTQTITPVVTEELMFSDLEAGQEHYYHLTDTHCYAYAGQANPGLYYALGIQWTAPADGRVDISGTYIENYMYQATPNEGGLMSDGVRVCVLLNSDTVVYPSAGQWYTINSADRVYFDQPVFNVKAGDTLTFILDKNGESNWDSCDYNVTIRFAKDGENFTEIYNSKTDFLNRSETAAFKYLAVDFAGEEEDRVIPPLAVLDFVNGGGNGNLPLIIGLSVGGGVIVVAAAVVLIVLAKKGVFKKKGGAQ